MTTVTPSRLKSRNLGSTAAGSTTFKSTVNEQEAEEVDAPDTRVNKEFNRDEISKPDTHSKFVIEPREAGHSRYGRSAASVKRPENFLESTAKNMDRAREAIDRSFQLERQVADRTRLFTASSSSIADQRSAIRERSLARSRERLPSNESRKVETAPAERYETVVETEYKISPSRHTDTYVTERVAKEFADELDEPNDQRVSYYTVRPRLVHEGIIHTNIDRSHKKFTNFMEVSRQENDRKADADREVAKNKCDPKVYLNQTLSRDTMDRIRATVKKSPIDLTSIVSIRQARCSIHTSSVLNFSKIQPITELSRRNKKAMRDSEYKSTIIQTIVPAPAQRERYTKIEIIEERGLPSHLSFSRSRESLNRSTDKVVQFEETTTTTHKTNPRPYRIDTSSSSTRPFDRVSKLNQIEEKPKRVVHEETTVIYHGISSLT